MTTGGVIELRRRRFRCPGCGLETVPLDVPLGLEPRLAHSLGVRERARWQVTDQSYAKAAATLAELRGWPVSHGELHRWVGVEGARLEASVARAQAELFEHARDPSRPRPDTVWISADGTMVHDRGTGRAAEVKLGLVFSERTEISPGRGLLLDRRLYGETESWTTFAERFAGVCARLGVYDARRSFFVADGAEWLKWLAERYFPDAVYLLDWYHLVDRLRWGIGPDAPEVLARALELARPGDVDGLLGLLASVAAGWQPSDPERAAKIRATAGYVELNRTGIANDRIVPLASSGPMEKAVDIAICRRFKLRGMSWYRRGVTHLLRLRLLRLNETWQRYWQALRRRPTALAGSHLTSTDV